MPSKYHIARITERSPKDGWKALASAVIFQAVEDLHSHDLPVALDAAYFLATDAPLFSEFIGLETSPTRWLCDGCPTTARQRQKAEHTRKERDNGR